MDTSRPALWKIEHFRQFLEARKSLLAAEVNKRMEELLHGETRWLAAQRGGGCRLGWRLPEGSPARKRKSSFWKL